jgi:3-methylcrotonyl-CoA carboxylase alpha subunit
MGSKTASKEIMIKAGVPVVPGYHGEDQSLENFLIEAEKIGIYHIWTERKGRGGERRLRMRVDTRCY